MTLTRILTKVVGTGLVRLNRVLFLNTDQEWLGVLVSPRARPGRNGGVLIPVSECRRGSTEERIPPDLSCRAADISAGGTCRD